MTENEVQAILQRQREYFAAGHTLPAEARLAALKINVVAVEPLEGYRLALEFESGPERSHSSGVFDMSGYLSWPAFAPLADEAEFAKAYTDGVTVCWPGDIDIAPERLHTDCLRCA